MDDIANSTASTPDRDDSIANEVLADYTKGKEARKPYEGPWFVAGAMLRGQQQVLYDDTLAKLVSPSAPTYRVRVNINRIRPKIKARMAKFFKSRPRPIVVPASTDRKDILNARATEKAIQFLWNKLHLEEKYKEARGWASIASRGLWWFSWDDAAVGKVGVKGLDGTTTQQPAQIGEPVVEVGSPFELIVGDITKSRIGGQPWIIRAKLVRKDDVIGRYPELKGKLSGGDRLSQYADKLASLRPQSNVLGASASPAAHDEDVLVIEHFLAPNGKYPRGRYAVVIANQTVKVVEELPYGMWDHSDNPYPVVEFMDSLTPGQYWGPTQVEQLIDLQREYNFLRGLLAENIRMMARPKIIVYKQHNLKDGAWTNQAGEIVELNYVPGLPPPQIIQPANVAADVWNLLQLISKEFDDLTQIYPATEGKVGDSSSGFQTNLLQEASDGVHAPDIREDELSIQESAWKLRRLIKLGWTTPQMISILGPNSAPEVIEFSSAQIDEYAEVRVQAGSMLPELKSAKANMTMEMFKGGMFGNPQDATVRRRVLDSLDMGGFDSISQDERKDFDLACNENILTTQGQPIPPAQFYEDHATHMEVHANDLKSPEVRALPPQIQQAKIAHVITHLDFLNPGLAMGVRQQHGFQPMDPNQPNYLPIATPPPPPPPPPHPPEPPKTTISLKGPDLGNPMVGQLLAKEGLVLQPPAQVQPQLPGGPPPNGPGGPVGPGLSHPALLPPGPPQSPALGHPGPIQGHPGPPPGLHLVPPPPHPGPLGGPPLMPPTPSGGPAGPPRL